MFDYMKERVLNFIKSRVFVLMLFFIGLFLILAHRLYQLQIVEGEANANEAIMQIEKERTLTATRGNIYDRNGELLAYDELAYSVIIEDNGSYENQEEKNKEINKTLYHLIQMIEENEDSINSDFGIYLDENDVFQFTTDSGTTKRHRFIADVFGKKKIDELTAEQKNMTAEELIEYLCVSEINPTTKTVKRRAFDISREDHTNDEQLKLVMIRYNMWLNRYSKYNATKVATDINDNTRVSIMENLSELQGVSVEQDSVRRYNSAEYMASIIGYTGLISQDEYEEMGGEESEIYSLTDVIGKAGLEKELDEYLQGIKGKEVIYTDNVGKVLDTKERTDAKAGDDVYLTVDVKLQEAAYNIIEQKIAGILLDKIRNQQTFTSTQNAKDIVIPIYDVYSALFENEVINISHLSEPDAGGNEQAVNERFLQKQSSVSEQLRQELKGEAPGAYSSLSKEYKVYMSYIVNNLLTKNTGVLISDNIDENDETYIAWKKDESISLKDFLNYAIAMNWIDSSKLDVESKYSGASEVYDALVEYIILNLENDIKFGKKLYYYMLQEGMISGNQACLILFEQGVLEFNENDYNGLSSGTIGSYNFIRSKIESLEITPGQLGLEPCTGSAVITDTNTGEVLACVSYPGYDNNKLANTMDVDYYNYLYDNMSEPFYNHATQERTAPGSTYKMVTAAAGLQEGVINAGTPIDDKYVYKVGNSETTHKCNAHHGNGITVTKALEVSCNYFFYEVGFLLSKRTGNYVPDSGLESLKKYAQIMGLSQKTNIEISETEPADSDQYPVPSAIGQGNNNFTTAQLAKYVSTVANKGTTYNLTLLQKVTDSDGNVLKEFQAESNANAAEEIAPGTWNLLHKGMRDMITSKDAFKDVQMTVAGKTGTAQHNDSHPNHALFVGFAPYENPQIAFALRITNGYTSANTVEVARDLVKYYNKETTMEDIVTGTATGTTTQITD